MCVRMDRMKAINFEGKRKRDLQCSIHDDGLF